MAQKDPEESEPMASLFNARAALDRLANRLREGGPEMTRAEIKAQVEYAARIVNEYAPRSILRVLPAKKE